MMNLSIRPYRPGDEPALSRICLLTGANGADASPLYKDPALLGLFWAAPYAALEPELCFILMNDSAPSGYILGTRDSAAFRERCETEWFPALRRRYLLPAPDDDSLDSRIIRRIHAGHEANPELAAYPAHLHIDLLPEVQGLGWGRRLTGRVLDRLRELGVPAVHLRVSKANPRAVAFYEALGFHRIYATESSNAFGMLLT
jgi:GNAT superfamily N-acetyltransferase